MIEFYSQIKLVHIVAVCCSGILFFARGLLILNDKKWAMQTPVRILSYGIDTVLLTAALMLLTILPSALFANGWLWLKVFLLLIYIGFGSIALKRGQNHQQRMWSFVIAISVFLFMISIALAHHPLGFLTQLLFN